MRMKTLYKVSGIGFLWWILLTWLGYATNFYWLVIILWGLSSIIGTIVILIIIGSWLENVATDELITQPVKLAIKEAQEEAKSTD